MFFVGSSKIFPTFFRSKQKHFDWKMCSACRICDLPSIRHESEMKKTNAYLNWTMKKQTKSVCVPFIRINASFLPIFSYCCSMFIVIDVGVVVIVHYLPIFTLSSSIKRIPNQKEILLRYFIHYKNLFWWCRRSEKNCGREKPKQAAWNPKINLTICTMIHWKSEA